MSIDIYEEDIEINDIPPKKRRSGCLIAVIIAAIVIFTFAVGAFAISSGLFISKDGNEKKVEEQLIQGFRNHDEMIVLAPISQEDLNPIIEKVQRMPEFFYLSGEYSCLSKAITGKVELTVKYSYDEIDAKQAEIDNAVNSMLSTIPADANDYEKIVAVHDWLCDHIVYELSEDSSDQNIYGALAKGSCVCSGYAKSFSYILDILGIENEYLTGTACDSNGETGTHAWNTAIIDGDRYYFDVTWDDASEKGKEYFYFAITEDEMNLKHYVDETTERLLAESRSVGDGSADISSSSTDDNYYYHNDYVLWTSSPSELSSLIKCQGNGVARIKCRDAAVYSYLTKVVKNSHEMYNVMTAAGIHVSNIYCVSNNDMMCMSIYY